MHNTLLMCVCICVYEGLYQQIPNTIASKSSCALKSYQDMKIILEGSRKFKYIQTCSPLAVRMMTPSNGTWHRENSPVCLKEKKTERRQMVC